VVCNQAVFAKANIQVKNWGNWIKPLAIKRVIRYTGDDRGLKWIKVEK
jgi:hypothetical protein